MAGETLIQNSVAVEWVGAITGLSGAVLLSLNIEHSGYGFIFFLISNVAWIIFSIRNRTYSLLAQQVGFTATSIIGVLRWLG